MSIAVKHVPAAFLGTGSVEFVRKIGDTNTSMGWMSESWIGSFVDCVSSLLSIDGEGKRAGFRLIAWSKISGIVESVETDWEFGWNIVCSPKLIG